MFNQFCTPFGPLLMRGVLSDNVFDILLRALNSTRRNISEGYALEFTSPEQNIVHNELLDLTKEYMLAYFLRGIGRPKVQNLQIVDHIWVNYIKPAGIISCVAYLKVPKENLEANKIQWEYGESIHFSEPCYNQVPIEKDVWLFPADLKHMVYPYKSQRVSISCNFK